MADKVATPYADVATDTRTIGGQVVEVQRYSKLGASAIFPARITVNQAGASIAARDTRQRIVLFGLRTNTAVVDVVQSGQEVGTGFPIEAGGTLTLETTAAILLDTTVDGQVIAYVEEYET